MDNNKLELITELINSGSTFYGKDIEISLGSKDEIKITKKDNLNILDNHDDLFNQYENNYSARGVEIRDIYSEKKEILKEVFGDLCVSQKNESGLYDIIVLTHIDKKSKIEKGLEATTGVLGSFVALPGALVAKAGEIIKEGGAVPITLAVMGSGVTIPVAIVGVASLASGTAIALLPKLSDKVVDMFNGNEKEYAIDLANKLIGKELEVNQLPTIREALDNISDLRQKTIKQSNKNTI